MKTTKSTPPKKYGALKIKYPKVVKAYEQLGASCHNAGPLKPKSRELVKIGIAIGAGLESATKAHVRVARDEGVSADEIRHAALLATTTIGFPSMMRAMTWVNDILGDEQPAH